MRQDNFQFFWREMNMFTRYSGITIFKLIYGSNNELVCEDFAADTVPINMLSGVA